MKIQKQAWWMACAVVVIGGAVVWMYLASFDNDKKIVNIDPISLVAPSSQIKKGIPSPKISGKNQSGHSDSVTLSEKAPRQKEIAKKINNEYLYRALAQPNDPYMNYGQAFNYTKAPEAWDKFTGSPITIAVIDTGFGLNHEDLKTQWKISTAETGNTRVGDICWDGTPQDKSSNNCDDDKNGYKDDWRGWDFINIDNDPMAGTTNPSGAVAFHGTAVAGLAGAASNNGVGSASYNWQAKLMPLQVLDDDGFGFSSQVISAIYYAVDNGAKIINLSLGGNIYDENLKQATDYAYNKGVLVVAAAGNCGTGREADCNPEKPGQMGYPALNPHVLAVGATNNSGVKASFSSYGPGLDITAPGSGFIVGPFWRADNQTSLYTSSLYGTSFASPMAASLASLVMSLCPNMTVDGVTGILDGTAQKTNNMTGKVYSNEYGHGSINAQAAIAVASSLGQISSDVILSQTGSNISEHTFTNESVLSSGCTLFVDTYCTIWSQDQNTFYDRYLPYSKVNSLGQAGWNWSGTTLDSGIWRVRATSGDNLSNSYILFQK